jgi:hypothetical protein
MAFAPATHTLPPIHNHPISSGNTRPDIASASFAAYVPSGASFVRPGDLHVEQEEDRFRG